MVLMNLIFMSPQIHLVLAVTALIFVIMSIMMSVEYYEKSMETEKRNMRNMYLFFSTTFLVVFLGSCIIFYQNITKIF